MKKDKKNIVQTVEFIVIIIAIISVVFFFVSNAIKETAPDPSKTGDIVTKEDLFAGVDSNEVKDNINSLLKHFIIKKDDFTHTTFYTHKNFGKNWNNRNTIRAVVRDDGSYYMQTNYYGNDWIHHTHVIMLIDDITYKSPEISLASNSHATDNTAYEVWEVNSYNQTGDGNILQIISASKNKVIKVRFTGGRRVVDVTLSDSDKNAIGESMVLAINLSIIKKMRKN